MNERNRENKVEKKDFVNIKRDDVKVMAGKYCRGGVLRNAVDNAFTYCTNKIKTNFDFSSLNSLYAGRIRRSDITELMDDWTS